MAAHQSRIRAEIRALRAGSARRLRRRDHGSRDPLGRQPRDRVGRADPHRHGHHRKRAAPPHPFERRGGNAGLCRAEGSDPLLRNVQPRARLLLLHVCSGQTALHEHAGQHDRGVPRLRGRSDAAPVRAPRHGKELPAAAAVARKGISAFARAEKRRAGTRHPSGNGGQPRQARIPVQYVARHPHADERDHRLHLARGHPYRQPRTGARLPEKDRDGEPAPALAHQRRARHEPHRERQGLARAAPGAPARACARPARHHPVGHFRQAHLALHRHGRRGGRGRHRRPHAPQPDHAQHHVQRHQIHPGGRHDHPVHRPEADRAEGQRGL